MKQTNKIAGIIFSALAGITLIAGIVCSVLFYNNVKSETSSGNIALVIFIPFAIFFVLFLFLGIFNLIRYKKEKQRFESKKY